MHLGKFSENMAAIKGNPLPSYLYVFGYFILPICLVFFFILVYWGKILNNKIRFALVG